MHLQQPVVRPGSPSSLLLREALESEGGAPPPPALPPTADLCVVGGGFTGLWTAIHAKLLEPSAAVVVLEAGVCGIGASGRNGGFLMSSWSKFGTLAKVCGEADALEYATTVERAIGEIGDFCGERGIEAEFNRAGWVWAATNASQLGAWEGTLDSAAAAGVSPYRRLSREETEELTGSPVHLTGVFEANPATVNPARLVRGLRRVADDLGIVVCEQTAVAQIEEVPAPTLTTSRGTVRADNVVLATSAWAAAIPELKSGIVIVASDLIATDPIPTRLDELGLKPGISISDSRRAVHYYRASEDGRIIFGKGGGGVAPRRTVGSRFEQDPGRAEEVRRHFRRTYPALWDVPAPHSWRGAVDYARTGLPFIGRAPNRDKILIAAGFSGNGVTPSFVAGRHLATSAMRQEASSVPEALGMVPKERLPPEPLLFMGGEIVRRAIHRRERAEDEERAPSLLTRAVASLDPTSFVDSSAS